MPVFADLVFKVENVRPTGVSRRVTDVGAELGGGGQVGGACEQKRESGKEPGCFRFTRGRSSQRGRIDSGRASYRWNVHVVQYWPCRSGGID